MLVQLEHMSLNETVFGEAVNRDMKTALPIADTIPWVITVWYTCRYQKQRTFQMQGLPLMPRSGDRLTSLPAGQEKAVKRKQQAVQEAQSVGETVHFATLVDLYHRNDSGLDKKLWKCEGRVVLRGDIVKDDSGSHAVFTEQGSSASQMVAAKILDVFSRLPGCAGEASDAVSGLIPNH